MNRHNNPHQVQDNKNKLREDYKRRLKDLQTKTDKKLADALKLRKNKKNKPINFEAPNYLMDWEGYKRTKDAWDNSREMTEERRSTKKKRWDESKIKAEQDGHKEYL